MKLSIIIPMYNVEQYVERCLKSCIDQDLSDTDYEIIVVNDGSPDNSLKIAEDISSKCRNMKVINKDNGGLSSARNIGLSYAVGDYIWFIASDDWIESNCLQSLMKICYDNNLDGLFIQGIRYINGVTTKRSIKGRNINKVMTGQAYMKQCLLNCAAVKTITKREIITKYNLSFYEGIYHEDAEYSPRLYYYLNRVLESDNYVYYNRLVSNSITQSVNPKKGFDMLVVAKNLWDFMNNQIMDDELKKSYYFLIASDLNASFHNIYIASKSVQKEYILAFIKNKYLLDSYTLTNNYKFKIAGCLFKLFPSKVIQTYKLLKKLS